MKNNLHHRKMRQDKSAGQALAVPLMAIVQVRLRDCVLAGTL
ncbi:Hypothetical protein, conserved [Brucella abortus str. 2308 A]|uniref:Uncharacterized protein n=1 Tax=Brucella ceti str. Cudo TaxID=595497 RepID=C0G970_9HYPH|nr:hypothetical protein BCA52141_II1058 [Brucella canis HSK A52141]AEW18800.1 hypothetical protein BAA13334_II00392 [Brucella abortus A13334]AIB22160.1 Hypothetical protein BSPT1_II0080 [Brucella suis bv. 2]EEH13484.1 Hypothetical protein, conserved [Brucella ceti str. Cudo]EEP61660.1 Hypothetical protein, conserved [Brucella abortus str. 2308 A]